MKGLTAEGNLTAKEECKLCYSNEVRSYSDPWEYENGSFKTDLAILEENNSGWKPRVVIEAKLGSITTHDAITYSKKAALHRSVHPYLRYGIMLGNRRHYPLPGRLYRHGQEFDFMISFQEFVPSEKEKISFMNMLKHEVLASQTIEKIIYESRQKDRDHYYVLHRRLKVTEMGR